MNDIWEEDHNLIMELEEKDINSNKSSNDIDDMIIFQNDEILIHSDEKISFLGISNDSQLSIIINIVCSAIGGSCFNFPFIIEKLGLPLTLVIFILVMISVYYTIDLLRSFIIDTKYFSLTLTLIYYYIIIVKNFRG